MNKVKSLFEYLLALRHLTYEPVRRISDYEKFWLLEELPVDSGIFIGGKDAFIEVHQQQFLGDYPAFSPVLGRVLNLIKFDYTKEKSRLLDTSELKEMLLKELAELKVMASLGSAVKVDLGDWKQLLTETFQSRPSLGELLEKLDGAEALSTQILEEYSQWKPLWKEWARTEKKKRQVQKFYEYLFHLRQTLAAQERPLEIVLGKGMLYGQFKEAIHHPLITTRLELDFDPLSGVARLTPVPNQLSIEMEMLADIQLPNHKELMALKKDIEQGSIDPYDDAQLEATLKSFVRYLHPDGQFSKVGGDVAPTKKPKITMETSLFVREISTAKLTVDLKNTIDYINAGNSIPDTVKAIVGEAVIERSATWDQQLLFPMPANESQKKIAQLLSQYAAVTVQGPPGTGKSHTIANLTAHLVAHGYRVLVTSEKDKALTVLMNKLPEEIRDLCVSVIGNHSESLDQMIESVAAICQGMANFDEKSLTQDIQTLNRSLDMVKRQIHLGEQNLVRFRELDAKGTLWKDRMAQPYELAQIAAVDKERFDFVTDPIEMDALPPLSNEEFSLLWDLRGRLTAEDLEVGNYRLPTTRILSTEEFLRLLEEKNQYERHLKGEKGLLHEVLQDRNTVAQLDQRVEKVAQMIEGLESEVQQKVLADCLLDRERFTIWRAVYDQLQGIIVAINAHELKSMNVEVSCPFYGHEHYEDMMRTLRGRLEAGKKISGLFLMFNGELKAFYENTRINNQKISKLEHLLQIKWHQEKNQLLEEFAKIWNRHFVPLGATILDPHHGQVLFNYHSKLKELNRILEVSQHFTELGDYLQSINPDTLPLELEELSGLQEAVVQAKYRQKLEGWKEVYQTLLRQYKGPLLGSNMHPVCKELYEVLAACDAEKFPVVRQRLEELQGTFKDVQQFLTILETFKGGLPDLALKVRGWVGLDREMPGTFMDIFDYGKLKTFLEKIESWNPDDLELKLRLMEEEQSKLVRKLIKKMAWKHQLGRITADEERALLAWLQKVQRYEKGSAKAIEAIRQQSKKELQACQAAIPVWVMPVKEVLETFPANPDFFDVIIVDEASQCAITSLPILMRANKAVIVGDDQQISPVLPGISDAQVQELAGRYLHEFATIEDFDLQTSLYDVTTRSYTSKGKLMLKEHFRCVPEIIAFSNGLSYQNQMIPLKLPLESEKFDKPVEAIFVAGSRDNKKKINELEASQIVEDIVSFTKNPDFDGKTFGVISLLGAEQAKHIQKLLVEAIGEAEIMKRELMCGDAYSFQGDERDVMFLSLVVAPNARFATLNKKMYTQRFNVAASRARSMMRLYHSVQLEDLNTDDVRYKLLDYCQHPTSETFLPSGQVETILEKDVYEAIRGAGYQAKPKVQVGGYYIDLVIEGNRQRLAIECTGDSFYGGDQIEQDINRQRILERAGWKFQKIRASHFYLDKEQALAPIWEKLKELGIQKEESA